MVRFLLSAAGGAEPQPGVPSPALNQVRRSRMASRAAGPANFRHHPESAWLTVRHAPCGVSAWSDAEPSAACRLILHHSRQELSAAWFWCSFWSAGEAPAGVASYPLARSAGYHAQRRFRCRPGYFDPALHRWPVAWGVKGFSARVPRRRKPFWCSGNGYVLVSVAQANPQLPFWLKTCCK